MKTANGKDKAKEALKPVDDRKVGKKKPRRPLSVIMVFLEEFRRTFYKEYTFSSINQAGRQKWNSMSQAEKTPYEERAANVNADYDKLVDAYNKNMKKGSDEPQKFRSDVNDEDEAIDEADHLEKGKAGDEKGDRHLGSRFSGLKI